MDGLQVIDLEEGVEQHLDVALHVEAFLARPGASSRGRIAGNTRRTDGCARSSGSAAGSSLMKIQLEKRLAAHADQRPGRQVEAGEVALIAQIDQLAVERVGPAVISANQPVDFPAGGLHQRSAAMPAGVVERADHIVLAAHDEDGRAGFLPKNEAAAAAGVRRCGRRTASSCATVPPSPI